jgi:hypothetical protein
MIVHKILSHKDKPTLPLLGHLVHTQPLSWDLHDLGNQGPLQAVGSFTSQHKCFQVTPSWLGGTRSPGSNNAKTSTWILKPPQRSHKGIDFNPLFYGMYLITHKPHIYILKPLPSYEREHTLICRVLYYRFAKTHSKSTFLKY